MTAAMTEAMTDHAALIAQARSVLREWRVLPEDRRAPQVACGLFAALADALEAALARAERAERALLCERGDPAGAPEGWRYDGPSGQWIGRNGRVGRTQWVRQSDGAARVWWWWDTAIVGEEGHADTALDAMERADEAAKGERP